jgi:hypothetical protein
MKLLIEIENNESVQVLLPDHEQISIGASSPRVRHALDCVDARSMLVLADSETNCKQKS